MCATFTDDDVDKPVENAAGDQVGVVATVEGDIAHVRPAADAIGSVKSSLGWEGVTDETHPLDSDSVREITDDAVRLEGELPTGDDAKDASDTGIEADEDATPATEPAGGSAGTDETDVADDLREETGEETIEEMDSIDDGSMDRGLEADPTELAKENQADGSRTDAAVELDGEPRRTDAAVDPGEQPRRTDAEVDSDAVRDADPASSGPTTEGAGRTDLEESPEQERRSDLGDESDGDSNREAENGTE